MVTRRIIVTSEFRANVTGMANMNKMATSSRAVTAGMRAQEKQVHGSGKAFGSLGHSVTQARIAFFNYAVIIGLVSGAMRMLAKPAIELEREMDKVQVTTGMTNEELKGLKTEMIELSTSLPTSAVELAKIAVVAGQLGIEGTDNIKSFTTTIAIMAQSMEEVKSAKEAAAYTILATTGSYTASVSIKQASGYTDLLTSSVGVSGSYVTSGSVLTPSDLVKAKKDLKTSGTRKIIPDVVLMATEQLSDLETHADFSPGQTSNANFKKAVFDENGTLTRFDGMEIVEAIQMPQITTGYFASSSGHFCYVGKKGLLLGRGENTKLNKVETFRDPKQHGTELTLDVSYKHGILYSKAIRAIACSDT